MPEVRTRGRIKTTVTGEHRTGFCEKCGVKFEDYDTGEVDEEFRIPITVKKCPQCGGNVGRLVAKTFSIQPPNPPQCLRFQCLYRFFIGSLFCGLLSNYHRRRVAYAEANHLVADEVDNQWRVRRAGINPVSNKKYPYTKSFNYFAGAEQEMERVYNKIPKQYRTGEPSPKTIWQTIKEILILKTRR